MENCTYLDWFLCILCIETYLIFSFVKKQNFYKKFLRLLKYISIMSKLAECVPTLIYYYELIRSLELLPKGSIFLIYWAFTSLQFYCKHTKMLLLVYIDKICRDSFKVITLYWWITAKSVKCAFLVCMCVCLPKNFLA